MPNFFKTTPKKGDPFSKPGFMAGIAKMAYALKNMKIEGGNITWSGLGAPMITVDPSQLPEGTADQALKNNGTEWIALPVLDSVDSSGGEAVEKGERVVVGLRTTDDGLIQPITKGLLEEDTTPEESGECAPDDEEFPSDIDDTNFPSYDNVPGSSFGTSDGDGESDAGCEGDTGEDFPGKVDACW